MKRKIKCLFLTVAMLLSVFSSFATTASASSLDSNSGIYFSHGGTGTIDDPYIISTADELYLFRDLVNGGKNKICATVINNIDLNNIAWTPICLDASGYCGVFDGGGWAIKNMNVCTVTSAISTGSSSVYGAGLFGMVGASGIVKNVNISGVITNNESYDIFPDIGGIAGSNFGTIEECFSTCTIKDFNMTCSDSGTGHVNIGGIVGYNKGMVKNCYTIGSFDVNITFTQNKVPVNCGGIVGIERGYSDGGITNCYSALSIRVTTNSTSNIGGIMGELDGSGTYDNVYSDMQYSGAPSVLCGTGGSSYLSNSAMLSTAEMKSTAFPTTLGFAFHYDTSYVNQGYPILAVMLYDEVFNESPWFKEEIGEGKDSISQEIITNCLFNKDYTKPITRIEFASIALKLYEELSGKTVETPDSNPFTDTDSIDVLKAYSIGITAGESETTFNPYSYLTRQDMATMLVRAYKAATMEGWTLSLDDQFPLDYSGTAPFSDDAYIADYARPSVYFLVKHGIIKGITDNTFGPTNTTPEQKAVNYANATREQAIILVVRSVKGL